jgi:hypothetical protein
MNHISHNSLVGFYRVLTLVSLPLTFLAHAEERLGAQKYQRMAKTLDKEE